MRNYLLVLVYVTLLASMFVGCQSITNDDADATSALSPTSNPSLTSDPSLTTDPSLTSNISVTTAISFTNIYIGGLGDTYHAFRSPSGNPDVTRIEIQSDLDDFWSWHTTFGGGRGLGNVPDPMPVVDFTKELVVVITDFIYSSGGHSIKVVSAVYGQDAVTLNIQKDVAGIGCITTLARQQPYAIIKFDRPAQEFSLSSNITTSITNCVNPL